MSFVLLKPNAPSKMSVSALTGAVPSQLAASLQLAVVGLPPDHVRVAAFVLVDSHSAAARLV